jgi:hypothetical protein
MFQSKYRSKPSSPSIPPFFKLWFAFVALMAISIIGLQVYVLFNPEVIGTFLGEIVKGFNSVTN